MNLKQKRHCPYCDKWKLNNEINFKKHRLKCRNCYNNEAKEYQARHVKKPEVMEKRREYFRKRYQNPEIRAKLLAYQREYQREYNRKKREAKE